MHFINYRKKLRNIFGTLNIEKQGLKKIGITGFMNILRIFIDYHYTTDIVYLV